MTPDEIERALKEGRWMRMTYRCPQCRAEWNDEWDAACDSECPGCGLRNVTPTTVGDVTP